ncbi:MAG: hypothetical protein LBC70_03250 [Chitinispirillales bacterium]|jgi:hypothetical protein|nr:hypothetical protein [Chitinispirillales bacterium]
MSPDVEILNQRLNLVIKEIDTLYHTFAWPNPNETENNRQVRWINAQMDFKRRLAEIGEPR